MLYGLFLSASGLQAQEYRQAVTANNLANAQTTGFKRDLAVFQARANAAQEDPSMSAYRTSTQADQGGGVLVAPTGIDLSQGVLTPSHNSTDLALDGQGFMLVQGPDKQKLLTRDGRFIINTEGELVSATNGQKLLADDGQSIKVTPGVPVEILTSGEIRQAGTTIAQLAMVNVKNPASLSKLGGNTFQVNDPANDLTTAPPETLLRQGFLENSGVDPMVEMVQMMEGQRIYEANAKMISYQDQALGMLNQVGRMA